MGHPAGLTDEELIGLATRPNFDAAAMKLFVMHEQVAADAQLRKCLWWAAAQMNRYDAMEFKQGLRAVGVEPWEI